MSVGRQQSQGHQLDLFDEALKTALGHGGTGEGGTGSGPREELQARTAMSQQRALTRHLMEQVAGAANLERAWKRVKLNHGAPGVDGMTVQDLRAWLADNREDLVASLLGGSYRPEPVRGVAIPKLSDKGERQLGIPTVKDRLVQQAVLQVLQPLFDPGFSAASYGFRPGRSAHDALRQAQAYVREGQGIVVDLDLEKFFDRVNHDILMARLARRIGDTRLLGLIRRFLEAGMMQDGVCQPREEGTPQGGPLSPLLANLLLDDLDKELERRGHRFCRYADDVNIYVRSVAAGTRVLASITEFLERRLRLKVNHRKSAVAKVEERTFLGYRILRDRRLSIAPESWQRMKQRVREITKRSRGVSFERVIRELNAYLSGWVGYFRLAAARSRLAYVDKWLRRRLRGLRLKHCQHFPTTVRFLRSLGVRDRYARYVAASGKGWWRKARSPQAEIAMSKRWFREQGLTDLVTAFDALQPQGKPPCT